MRVLWLILVFFLFAVRDVPVVDSRSIFGVRISMTTNSQMTSYIAYRQMSDGIIRDKRTYTKDEFIRILSGDWPSVYNPKRINYFEQNAVFGGVYVNDTIKKSYPFCPAFDSLWKIRFSDYPFRTGNEKGWSMGMYKPSSKQEIYLANRYHFKQLDFEYIIDTNFWKLLRDVTDTNWVRSYKFLN